MTWLPVSSAAIIARARYSLIVHYIDLPGVTLTLSLINKQNGSICVNYMLLRLN